MSVWAMAHHCHAVEPLRLSRAAGVMLSVKQSDRNANQVSKLTPRSHRCTSGRRWFISQRKSMCHHLQVSRVNMPPAQGPALSDAFYPDSPRTTFTMTAWDAGTVHVMWYSIFIPRDLFFFLPQKECLYLLLLNAQT